MTFKPTATVREIAVQVPLSIRVFEEIGIDYCCGSSKSLVDACRQAGVPVELAVQKLSRLNDRIADPDLTPWQEAPLCELTQHIVQTHHEYVRKEIPRLESLLEKVNGRHAKAHPELTAIKVIFAIVAEEMLNHMQKEEQVLFPYIERLDRRLGRACFLLQLLSAASRDRWNA